jgi:mRNA-degrading endonuclease RelE of RelBE toxin-antitoxin system
MCPGAAVVEPQSAILSFHSNAGRHVGKLDRAARARLVDFQTKFSANINQPGLRLKPLKGNGDLWSARVSDDYRAIMCRAAADRFVLIAGARIIYGNTIGVVRQARSARRSQGLRSAG